MPYFTADFLKYIDKMSGWAKALTPHAKIFISPYGTRRAVNDAKFRSQLQSLPVDYVAYQDEVGCVRDELPSLTAAKAFLALRAAHSAVGKPQLWANIESFTWQIVPNNDKSALIPAEWPRVAAQLSAASHAGVERVITFTAEAIYENGSNSAISWGPPSAKRLFDSYIDYGRGNLESKVLMDAVSGQSISSIAVGKSSGFVNGQKDVRLVDGLVGPQSPYSVRWIDGAQGKDLDLTVSFDSKKQTVQAFGAHFLQVPGVWFLDGNSAKPQLRNITSGIWLPTMTTFFVKFDVAASSWQQLAQRSTDFWEREKFDIRTDLAFYQFTRLQRVAALRIVAECVKPAWAQNAPIECGRSTGRLVVDEFIVL